MHTLLQNVSAGSGGSGGGSSGSSGGGGSGSNIGVDSGIGRGTQIQNVAANVEFRPLTDVLRQSTAPLFATIDAPGSYRSVSHLIERGFEQEHHQIGGGIKGWNNDKLDPQRWSQLTKVYERVKWKMAQLHLDSNLKTGWMTAASLLDAEERNGMTIPKYVKWIRGNVSQFKKRAQKRKRT